MIPPTPGTIQFQEKVSRLLTRKHRKPVLKPNRPLFLKDRVANRKPHDEDAATCITEMMHLMACWNNNNFVDTLCSCEIDSFNTCVKNAQAEREKSKKGSTTDGKLTPKQVTTLLKRFPNPIKEI